MDPFCQLKGNKNFSGKSTSVTYFVFSFLLLYQISLKLMNRSQGKLVADVETDGQSCLDPMGKHEFIGPPLLGVQNDPEQSKPISSYLSLF